MRKTLLLCAATLLLMGCKSTSTPTSTTAAKAVNANCVMQQDRAVDPEVTVTFEETTVGFCCNKCAAKFEEMTVEEQQTAVAKAK